jgi:hypothetical protein
LVLLFILVLGCVFVLQQFCNKCCLVEGVNLCESFVCFILFLQVWCCEGFLFFFFFGCKCGGGVVVVGGLSMWFQEFCVLLNML